MRVTTAIFDTRTLSITNNTGSQLAPTASHTADMYGFSTLVHKDDTSQAGFSLKQSTGSLKAGGNYQFIAEISADPEDGPAGQGDTADDVSAHVIIIVNKS